MAHLRAFGGLRLENGHEAGLGRASQRRRLAVLALLAVTPERRLTRDKVLAILWPEATESEGRHRLSSAIYDLRQALGDDVVASAGDQIWLGSGITSDVEQFEAAVEKRDWELAVSTYGGPLLDGVHLSDALGFDEWLSSHRERLRRAYVGSCEQLVGVHVARRDASGGIAAARRLLDAEPLSGRTAIIAAEAVATFGGRSEAVRALETHAERIRSEIGTEPDDDVVRMLHRLRSATSTMALTLDKPNLDAAHTAQPKEGATARREPTSAPRVARRARVYAWFSAASLVTVGIVGGIGWQKLHATALPVHGLSAETAQVDGDATTSPALVADISNRLVVALQESGVADSTIRDRLLGIPRSAALRARVSTHEGRVHVSATLRNNASNASVATAELDAPADSVASQVAALARELIAGALENNNQHLAAAAARSTQSLAALEAFLTGEQAYRTGRYSNAARSFGVATTRDSSFSLAHYRLALTGLWDEQPLSVIAGHDSLAAAGAARLPPDERFLIDGYIAWRRGDAARADSLFTLLTRRNPKNAEAWYQLGETLFHYNSSRAAAVGNSLSPFAHVLLLDSLNWGARWHLLLIDASRLRQSELGARVNALLADLPSTGVATELRLFTGDLRDPETLKLAANANGQTVYDAMWRRAVYRDDLAGAEELLRAASAPERSVFERGMFSTGMGIMRLGRGKFGDALPLLLHGDAASRDPAALVILAQTMLVSGDERASAASDSLRTIVKQWSEAMDPNGPVWTIAEVTAPFLHALLAVQGGDTTSARALARRLASMPTRSETHLDPRRLSHVIAATIARRAHDPRATIEQLDQATGLVWLGVAASSPLGSSSLERFLRADALRALGRNREAIAWYKSFDQATVFDIAFLPAVLRGEAASHRALGELETAKAVELRAAALVRDTGTGVGSAPDR